MRRGWTWNRPFEPVPSTTQRRNWPPIDWLPILTSVGTAMFLAGFAGILFYLP